MKFNANVVVDAIVNAANANGAFVRAMVEQREAAGKTFKADAALLAIGEGLTARIAAGDMDPGCFAPMMSNARTMCECSLTVLIAACEEGQGVNGVCKRIRAVVGKRSNAGRPKGQGAGKTTKPADDAAQAEAPTVPNEDRAWKLFLEGLRHQVPQRKDWESQDIVAFQDCIGKMIALINRNAK
jgi:hypothetical protein